MLGFKLIEKMLEDSSLSIFEKGNNFEIVFNSKDVLFQIHKESLSINLYFDAWELVAENEEMICNKVLCIYLKLNYLVQNGLFRMLIEGNTSSTELNNLTRFQSCLSFFKDFRVEKSKELSVHQLQLLSNYATKKHQSFSRV